MDNREIDKLVAEKVMGWPFYKGGITHRVGSRVYPHSALHGHRGRAFLVVDTDDGEFPREFIPSADIAAAWQVIEKMHGRGFRYVIRGYFAGTSVHTVAFDEQDWADSNPLYQATATTMPLAICYAALKAIAKDMSPANELPTDIPSPSDAEAQR